MLTTDPGDSDEGYACKVLEVLIIHCHQSDAGGWGRITGGWGGNTKCMGGVMSQWMGGVRGGRGGILYKYL